MKFLKRPDAGFTVIELVVVIIILCILGTLVALTYSGVQSNNRDNQRQSDIDTLQSQLELYYAVNDKYPLVAEINDPTWRAQNLKDFKEDILKDPKWSEKGTCAQKNKPILASGDHCYNYEVTASDGAVCDNATAVCAHYTLTGLLENGEKYVKASLN